MMKGSNPYPVAEYLGFLLLFAGIILGAFGVGLFLSASAVNDSKECGLRMWYGLWIVLSSLSSFFAYAMLDIARDAAIFSHKTAELLGTIAAGLDGAGRPAGPVQANDDPDLLAEPVQAIAKDPPPIPLEAAAPAELVCTSCGARMRVRDRARLAAMGTVPCLKCRAPIAVAGI